MEAFLNKLYGYEYFGTYLMISIAVLLLLFIIILIFGKKDQKHREIEATKKLQQINEQNTFKEESNIQNVEVPQNNPVTPEVSVETLDNKEIVPNVTINPPVVDEIETIPEPVIPIENPVVEENKEEVLTTNTVEEKKEEPSIPDNIIPNIENINENEQTLVFDSPLLNKEEEKPLVVDKPEASEVVEFANTIPTFNFEEAVGNTDNITPEMPKEETPEVKLAKETVVPNVFSSVYVSEKDEVETPVPSSDELDFELPKLKEEVAEKNEEVNTMEMPALNDLKGETYDLK